MIFAQIVILLGLVVLLVLVVADRKLTEAREAREAALAYEAQREAQQAFDRDLDARLRAADAKRNRDLEALRQQASLDQVQLDGILASAAEQSRQERARNLGTVTTRAYAPAPAPARTAPSSSAPCSTTQPHHYLPGGIYAPATDSRSDRSDCGGSSWSGSSDSGSSSCDSSSSSSGGGE